MWGLVPCTRHICRAESGALLCQGKLVSAVCHGPAAFTEAKLDGQPIVKGKKVGQMSLQLLSIFCMAADSG